MGNFLNCSVGVQGGDFRRHFTIFCTTEKMRKRKQFITVAYAFIFKL